MRNYLHQDFLALVGKDTSELEEPLQQLIFTFNELEKDRNEVDEDDVSLIDQKLIEIDSKIYDMLTDELADELNDQQATPVFSSPDEKLLFDLFSPMLEKGHSKITNITRSFLEKRGFTTKLKGKIHVIGRYTLTRESRFEYRYTLTLTKD